jgi:hypothetical protein
MSPFSTAYYKFKHVDLQKYVINVWWRHAPGMPLALKRNLVRQSLLGCLLKFFPLNKFFKKIFCQLNVIVNSIEYPLPLLNSMLCLIAETRIRIIYLYIFIYSNVIFFYRSYFQSYSFWNNTSISSTIYVRYISLRLSLAPINFFLHFYGKACWNIGVL